MKRHAKKNGFTIPEVVITSLLIVIVMLPISNLSFQIIRNTKYSQDLGTAMALGQEKLEAFGSEPYNSIQPGTETRDAYTLTWTVTEANNSKVVQMIVRWNIRNQTRGIELSTVYPSNFNAGFSFE